MWWIAIIALLALMSIALVPSVSLAITEDVCDPACQQLCSPAGGCGCFEGFFPINATHCTAFRPGPPIRGLPLTSSQAGGTSTVPSTTTGQATTTAGGVTPSSSPSAPFTFFFPSGTVSIGPAPSTPPIPQVRMFISSTSIPPVALIQAPGAYAIAQLICDSDGGIFGTAWFPWISEPGVFSPANDITLFDAEYTNVNGQIISNDEIQLTTDFINLVFLDEDGLSVGEAPVITFTNQDGTLSDPTPCGGGVTTVGYVTSYIIGTSDPAPSDYWTNTGQETFPCASAARILCIENIL